MKGIPLLQTRVVRLDPYQRIVLLRCRHRKARVQPREARQYDAVAERYERERAHVDLRGRRRYYVARTRAFTVLGRGR